MPVKYRVVGANPTQGRSFVFKKRVVLNVVELLVVAFIIVA